MKKMIDQASEEGARIQDEIEKQVCTELGLTGVSVDDMSIDDFWKYEAAVINRQCASMFRWPFSPLTTVIAACNRQ